MLKSAITECVKTNSLKLLTGICGQKNRFCFLISCTRIFTHCISLYRDLYLNFMTTKIKGYFSYLTCSSLCETQVVSR